MTNKQKKILLIFFVTAVALLIIFTLVFTEKGFYTNYKLNQEKEALKITLDSLKRINDSLRTEIELLKSDDFKIEKVAREKYGMVREGEKIYKIETEDKK